MAWVLDLDGVVWLGDSAIGGSVAAIRRLRAEGHRVLYVTNNSFSSVAAYLAKFERMGIELDSADLCTSAQAAAVLLEPGNRALVLGGAGITEALEARGIEAHANLAPGQRVDAVVVGFHRDFSYERLALGFRAVREGARFIATNDDATYPTPDGPIPGGGSIVAALAYATRVTPEVAGKPNAAIATVVRERLAAGPRSEPAEIMVGDRPSTDGAMARTLECRFGLVLSGVTTDAGLVDPPADIVAADLASLVDTLLGSPS